MFRQPSEKEIKKLRPKVKMGGSVTKNGVNVDKEIEAQTAKKMRGTSDGFMARGQAQAKKERSEKRWSQDERAGIVHRMKD
jgi:hypothetical protein